MPRPRPFIFWFALAGVLAARGAPQKAVFDQPVSTRAWTLAEFDPALPSDWTGYDFLVLELRASSSQRFELGLRTAGGLISKKIHPLPGVWLRASIPLRFYRQGLGDGADLAATVNQPRNTYWINIEGGGYGPTKAVRGLEVTMRYPAGHPSLEIRSVRLAREDPGDDILEGKPVVDAFGQYVHADWPGKAHGASDLKRAWAEEDAGLAAPFPGRSEYGGFAQVSVRATGYFRVERIDGRWWLVAPDGHLFYAAGMNAVSPYSATRVRGREDYFAALPRPLPLPAGSPARMGPAVSFYTANLERRFGPDWRRPWAELTARRFRAWGLNTANGTGLADEGQHVPYVITLHSMSPGPALMNLPDVYAEDFPRRVLAAATEQLAARRNDPWMIGYFIGNEPPWPGRESQLVDLIRAGPATELQRRLRSWLAGGDTPARRQQFILNAFARYLEVVNAAVKQADPHHLNLGIRFGGTPPDAVVRLARGFDVYSFNKYRYAVPASYLDHLYQLTGGRPILIGEFHIGAPDRGMAPGLVQAADQSERGVAYRYYVEQAAAHPAVVGALWFEWIDEPVTGRFDGENYNIGWIDVTDRPYAELVAAAQQTHARLFGLHAGTLQPVARLPRASDVGTPADAALLALPGIQ